MKRGPTKSNGFSPSQMPLEKRFIRLGKQRVRKCSVWFCHRKEAVPLWSSTIFSRKFRTPPTAPASTDGTSRETYNNENRKNSHPSSRLVWGAPDSWLKLHSSCTAVDCLDSSGVTVFSLSCLSCFTVFDCLKMG
ncbi:hypothetical protein SLA2020_504110 [Shorea laevis]